MACEICGNTACSRSFHSIEEQEKFDAYSRMDLAELVRECMAKDDEILDLKNEIERIEE